MAETREEEDRTILHLRDIYKNFKGLQVLSEINLKIKEGERHAIIGPNGAGKSTIFNLISGKYLPSHGKIFFKGMDVTGESPFKLNRKGLSRSFQITNIFRTMTVFQNVQMAVLSRNNIRYNMFSVLSNMDGIIEETERIIGEIGLLEQKNMLAAELPYGHQRALEIGLTLATDPEVILLDEPSAGMTTEETKDTVKLIERVTKGKTLLIVEHDMEVVFSLAHRIKIGRAHV